MCDKKNENLKLNDYDITINNMRQDTLFKGTIAICVGYGILASIILLLAILSPVFRNIVFQKFLIFTLVFILGTIIIICIFIYYIINFKPVKIDLTNMYDNMSCPDYWKMEILDDNIVNNIFDPSINSELFKYRCVMDNHTFDKLNIIKTNANTTPTSKDFRLTNMSELTLPAISGDARNIANTYDKNNETLTPFINNIKYAHLYKNINAYDTSETSTADKPYFGNNINSEVATNIKNDLIDTSLLMNNYKFDNSIKNYSNISSNTLNFNNSTITWDSSTNGTTRNILDANNNSAIIISWNNKDLNYFNSILNDKNADTLYVFSNDTTNAINIGQLKIKYDEDTNQPISLTFISNNNIPKTAVSTTNFTNNNYIIQTYISKNSSVNTMAASNEGPLVKIYNNIERPTITNDNKNTSNIPLVCDTIYPAFIASRENADVNGTQNALRCAYSKICGITWSDMSCN